MQGKKSLICNKKIVFLIKNIEFFTDFVAIPLFWLILVTIYIVSQNKFFLIMWSCCCSAIVLQLLVVSF